MTKQCSLDSKVILYPFPKILIALLLEVIQDIVNTPHLSVLS